MALISIVLLPLSRPEKKKNRSSLLFTINSYLNSYSPLYTQYLSSFSLVYSRTSCIRFLTFGCEYTWHSGALMCWADVRYYFYYYVGVFLQWLMSGNRNGSITQSLPCLRPTLKMNLLRLTMRSLSFIARYIEQTRVCVHAFGILAERPACNFRYTL